MMWAPSYPSPGGADEIEYSAGRGEVVAARVVEQICIGIRVLEGPTGREDLR
ncbi:Hypothetical protein PFR_JS13-2_1444 [Propionibacterium freudenreichii]|nr:Hypothetical protein PFR_JS8_1512 [Propionibacterium freudenreichii]SBN60378.1 Hypothetical protein PFR_JS11_1456 [Propionibacterium freudenreichii]SCQ49019.1 Hypothetical protein PFR_JS13-1_1456 [Propionibacterium freudenreichii]SCQ54261.1 Hypothetical protein PFR_JS13-2_1444 [Propionibacterium freudenreichii]